MSVVHTQILPNNIVLLTESDMAVKTAAIGFWFSAGSRYETAGCRGITHFVEHMLFKGTVQRTAFSIACAFDSIGGYANAFTDREAVCTYCTVPAEHMLDALDVLCDMAESSVFAAADVERERTVIQSEIISSLDDAEECALDAAAAAVWPHSGLAASVAGSADDVAALSRDALYAWYERFFVRGPLVVCVSGAADAERIAERLALMGRHEPYAAPSFPVPQWKPGLLFEKAPFQQEQLFALFELPYPVDERRYFAYAVFNALAGDTMSSRLFQRLREQDGSCYTVYSFLNFYTGAGSWCAYASAPKKNTAQIAQGFFEELRTLYTEAVETRMICAAEIEAAKEHVCGEEIILCEEAEYRMKRLQRCFSFGFPFRTTDEAVSLIRSISADELYAAVREILVFNRMAFIVYGPAPAQRTRAKIERLSAAT